MYILQKIATIAGNSSKKNNTNKEKQRRDLSFKTKKSMYVVKRDGRKEPVMFDKITDRIKTMLWFE
jgi:hypothetical protein